MNHPESHVMNAVLIEDRQTVRYTCPVCLRCVEDGPDGITTIHKGDPSASHRGGSILQMQHEIHQQAQGMPLPH